MPIDPLTINDIKEAFFSLKTNKSFRYDEIGFNVIKNWFSKLDMPLKYLFEISLKKGIFLDKLKTTTVIPLFKAEVPANIIDPYESILVFFKYLSELSIAVYINIL